MSLYCPCALADRSVFSPSLLGGLDDIILNYSYLPMVLDLYTKYEDEKNPFISVRYLDDEILKHFPTMKIQVADNDPLRDDILRFILKLLKNDVKVDITLYRHQTHGFLGHSFFPETRNMEEVAMKKAIENLTEEM